jgi:hypothetical protein
MYFTVTITFETQDGTNRQHVESIEAPASSRPRTGWTRKSGGQPGTSLGWPPSASSRRPRAAPPHPPQAAPRTAPNRPVRACCAGRAGAPTPWPRPLSRAADQGGLGTPWPHPKCPGICTAGPGEKIAGSGGCFSLKDQRAGSCRSRHPLRQRLSLLDHEPDGVVLEVGREAVLAHSRRTSRMAGHRAELSRRSSFQ